MPDAHARKAIRGKQAVYLNDSKEVLELTRRITDRQEVLILSTS